MCATQAARPGATTKADLVEAGIDLILEHGYNHCGLDQILKVAGSHKGSFYYFFKSKEDFGLHVVDTHAERRLAQLDRDLGDRDFRPLDRLRRFFEGSARRHRDLGYRKGCLFGNLGQEMADQSEAFRTRLEEVLGRYRAKIAGCLREAQAAGELGADLDAELLAGFCLNSWEGALLRMKVARSHEPLEDFLTVIFGAILKPPPPANPP